MINFRTTYFTLLCVCSFLPFFLNSCATSKLGAAGQRKTAGKTYVIAGASSGFGRGVAEQLGEYKANVVLAARRTDLLEEIANNIRAAGGTAIVVPIDISKAEDVKHLADTAVRHYGHIDVWINMAGVGAIGRFWEIPLEDQARTVDVNLKGFIYGSYYAVRQFTSQGYGTLINLGSVESHNPLAYHASYAATKGGILNLGAAISEELRLSGHKKIHVVTIEPWAVDTPFWRHSGNYTGGTPRMIMLDMPYKVVNAVIRASLRPRKEVPVGWKAKLARNFHRTMPRFTERLSAKVVHKVQIVNAPPAPNTSGSIHKAMKGGRGVDDGVKARVKAERRERRKHRRD